MQLLDLARFYLRRSLLADPALFILAALACLLLLASTFFYLSSKAMFGTGKLPLTDLAAQTHRPQATAVALDLPKFHTVPLVNAIERSSGRAGVAVNEITFTFDDTVTQPFLRYRANFTLVGRYPAIREFIDDVVTTLPVATLESVHCVREDTSASNVSCDMRMSAIYRRPGHE